MPRYTWIVRIPSDVNCGALLKPLRWPLSDRFVSRFIVQVVRVAAGAEPNLVGAFGGKYIRSGLDNQGMTIEAVGARSCVVHACHVSPEETKYKNMFVIYEYSCLLYERAVSLTISLEILSVVNGTPALPPGKPAGGWASIECQLRAVRAYAFADAHHVPRTSW